MLPIVFDWDWSLGRLIFMGFLYMALGIISIGLVTAFFMTLFNLKHGGGHHEPHGEAEH